MTDLFSNQYIILAFTFGVFYLARQIQTRTGWILFNPIFVAIVVIICYLKITKVSFATYRANAQLIEFWLKPAVVALGVPLYMQFKAIQRLWFPLIVAQFIGSCVGIVSAVLVAKLFGASNIVVISMAAKSVTTPIAMEVTTSLGGIPALTAAVVVITGVLGAIMGFKTLSYGHVNSPIAQGLSMGSATHAVGASTAMGHSPKYGAFASLGIILNGIFTSLITPTLLRLIHII